MTLQEAIRLLDPETTGEAIEEIKYYHGFSGKKAAIHAISDACEIACEAMRKQMPKKPTKNKSDNHFHCPKCNASRHINILARYCFFCGQPLDWSEAEQTLRERDSNA